MTNYVWQDAVHVHIVVLVSAASVYIHPHSVRFDFLWKQCNAYIPAPKNINGPGGWVLVGTLDEVGWDSVHPVMVVYWESGDVCHDVLSTKQQAANLFLLVAVQTEEQKSND